MSHYFQSRPLAWSRLPIGACLLALCLAGGGCHHSGGGGGATPATYLQKVSAFTIGTTALETADQGGHANRYLTLAGKIAPEEPAVWANLGLMALRGTRYDEAAQSLDRAEKMAPESAAVEKLIGLLDGIKGLLNDAIQHYTKAVQIAPDDLRARYALALILGNYGEQEGEQKQLEAILQRDPNNLLAMTTLAQVAARRGDASALHGAIDLLTARSSTFSPAARARLDELKTPTGRDAALQATFLYNLLKSNPSFYRSSVALTGETGTQGEPLQHFLKLPDPVATPAAPDTALAFATQPLPGAGGRAAWAGATWLDDGSRPNVPPGARMPTVVTLTSDGRSLRLSNGKTLVFPGGGAPPGPHGVLPLDFNYDLRMDFALAGHGGLRLYQQEESGDFTDVTAKTGLPTSLLGAAYAGVWQADIEADGDLDLVLAPVTGAPIVLRNNGDGTFKAIVPFTGVADVRGFAWGDLDGGGNPWAIFVDAHGGLHIYANDRGGLFRAVPAPSGIGKIAAIAVGAITPDGALSLIALQMDGRIVRLTSRGQDADWQTTDTARWTQLPKDLAPETALLLLADLDNNGGLDLIASTPTAAQAWLCDASYAFAPLPSPLPGAVGSILDLNGDGRLDLVGRDKQGQPVQMIGAGAQSYHWIELRPRAADVEFIENRRNGDQANVKGGDRRINSFGIGGDMEARAGLLYQKQVVAGPVVHFGLGIYPALDAVRIVWPNGDVRAEFGDELGVDRSITNLHRLKGSCPFLFAWNGKEMRFVTDCIWRSPLGLKINAQDTAGVSQTEDWVKIGGDQLVPRNGVYDLRITADLWETHFFDHLSLLTVDHPADSEIWVDERFAIPPPAKRIYVTGPLHPVARAVDDLGHDVSDLLRERDGRHLASFGLGRYQGVTRDHWVEIEPGDEAPKTGPLYLVCQGWIHPTDSSINVALGQSHYPPPQGLSVETPDAQGRWLTARRGLGFPEGKVKTILIPLEGLFRPGAPRKLRLRTNLEIYWDAIRWASGLPQAPEKTRRLYAGTAELRYRGFSVVKAADASSPELPQSYDQLDTTAEKWRDLVGRYTRYGDVRELLAHTDDRYVIMNAGDELRLTFVAPPAPAAGMRRDYVLIGDGWVKDGDYNTTFSRTVLPLPTHARSDYSTPPGRLEDDPVYRQHRQDWEVYHTRYVTPARFARGLRPGDD